MYIYIYIYILFFIKFINYKKKIIKIKYNFLNLEININNICFKQK